MWITPWTVVDEEGEWDVNPYGQNLPPVENPVLLCIHAEIFPMGMAVLRRGERKCLSRPSR